VTLPPLRVWLETDYDGGTFGAWLLDVPGAFGAAGSRDLAVSQSSVALGWFRDWLGRHGVWLAGSFGFPEVVEDVAATRVDGYERNATFADDARPVTPDELDAAIARMGYARDDLNALLPSLAAIGIATSQPERTVDEVLRHLAGAEIWLGSRLDPAARYDGPPWTGDGKEHLDATRRWAIDNLRALHAADARPRTDGKGETWTFRKVVRRYVYHSVDHLRELDRRLAVAERRADRLTFRSDHLDDPGPLVRLFLSIGWDRRAEDPQRVRAMLAGTRRTATAWDGDELVGFAREHGDGVFSSQISSVCVDPRWQAMGIAARLVTSLVEGRPEVRFALHAAPGMTAWYERLGFERDESAMFRRGPR
jgi:ribosomal protein S18 acetylase RimI-like enzyme